MNTKQYILKHEKVIFFSFILFFALSALKVDPLHHAVWVVLSLLTLIFITMLMGVFKVVKHADVLAERFGEPYGTLILTLSVIIVEVMLIITMMLVGKASPTLARDTMLSVLMIAVNGFAGFSLFVGGLRHRTQQYNLQGANAYLAVLIPLAIVCLIMPNHTMTAAVGEFSSMNAVAVMLICILLYATFMVMQTVTHTDFFKMSNLHITESNDAEHCSANSITFHVIFLVAGLISMILLSKQLATYLDFSLVQIGLPHAMGGFLIALLILMPEGYSAVQAAYQNDLQRAVNLCLGSALATICLTVPAVLSICLLLNQSIVLGLKSADAILMWLTLILSLSTFSGQKTNFLNGAVHLSVFIIYLVVLFS